MARRATTVIQQLQRELLEDPLLKQLIVDFRTQQKARIDESNTRAEREIPNYSLILSDKAKGETLEHTQAFVEQFVCLLESKAPPSAAFIRLFAKRRAEQKVPLQYLLHAYRIHHQTLSELLARNLTDLDTDANEKLGVTMKLLAFSTQYMNWASVVASAAYAERQNELGSMTSEQLSQFFESLISGKPLAPDVLRVARGCGAESSHLRLLVANNGSGTLSDEMLTALVHAFSRPNGTPLFIELDNLIIGALPSDVVEYLMSSTESTAIQTKIRKLDLRIGVSGEIRRASDGKDAYREAMFAMSMSHRERPMLLVGEIPLIEISLLQPDLNLRRLLPGWLTDWQNLSSNSRRELRRTLEAFADADMQASATAKTLDVHPNTVSFRLSKIRDLSRLDPRQYHDLTQLRAALKFVEQPSD